MEQENYIFQVKPQMCWADKILNKDILHVNCIIATEGAIEAHVVTYLNITLLSLWFTSITLRYVYFFPFYFIYIYIYIYIYSQGSMSSFVKLGC